MKILRVISSMNPKQGGPCQGIRNSIPELEKSNVRNEVVCIDEPDADYLGKDSFTIHAIGAGKKNSWGYNKNLIPWLLSNFHRFDKVIVHGLWSYHSHAAIKAIIEYRENNDVSPKVYIMPHGMLDPYFQKAKERRLKALRNEIYWKIIENKVINKADGILFTCEEELLLARTTFPNYKPKREINVGYGVELPPEHNGGKKKAFEEKVPKWNGKPFLLFLSRIHQKKGVDLLINAYLKLEKELDTIPQLVIAGPGLEHSYGKEIKLLASKSQNILFPGMLSGDAKWGAFYECEAFVLSSHQENFGISIVEALACSRFVLISNKVNIWREIKSESAGFVADDTALGTIELLNNWISLSGDEKLKMNEQAKATFEKLYAIGPAANKLRSAL